MGADAEKTLDRLLVDLSHAKGAARRLSLALDGFRERHAHSRDADLDLQALRLEVMDVQQRLLSCLVRVCESPSIAPSFAAARGDAAFQRFLSAAISAREE